MYDVSTGHVQFLDGIGAAGADERQPDGAAATR
jgi:hypothetical protein